MEQLQQRMKEQEKAKRKEKLAIPLTFQNATAASLSQAQPAQASGTAAPAPSAVRKDSSPVKVRECTLLVCVHFIKCCLASFEHSQPRKAVEDSAYCGTNIITLAHVP